MPLTPRQKNSLLWAYRGAGLPSNLGPSINAQTVASPIPAQQAQSQTQRDNQRAGLLANAIKGGQLKPDQLTAQDMKLVGPKLNTGGADFGGGFLSDVGHAVGNLGGDVFSALKSLPGGIMHTTQAIGLLPDQSINATLRGGPQGRDTLLGALVKHPNENIMDTQFGHDILKPLGESYAYTYAGKGAPKGSSFLGRVAQHPLGPILDLATIASLGTGGAIKGAQFAGRAGIESPALGYLAQAGKTSGRSPVTLNPDQRAVAGVEYPQVPRRWSSRPLMKAGQVAWDKIAENVGPAGNFTTNRTVKTLQRQTHATGLAAASAAVRAAVKPLVGSRRDLTADEATALDYALRGWNTVEKVEASRQMFKDSLSGNLPDGYNLSAFESMFKTPEDARAFVDYKANLPDSVERLILHPSERMINAAQATHEAAQEGFDKLGLTPEEIAARVGESQKILEDYLQGRLGQKPDEGGAPPQGPEPTPLGPNDQPPPMWGPNGEPLQQVGPDRTPDVADYQQLKKLADEGNADAKTILDEWDQRWPWLKDEPRPAFGGGLARDITGEPRNDVSNTFRDEPPPPESWEAMQQGAEDALGPQGPSGKGHDFQEALDQIKEGSRQEAIHPDEMSKLLEQHFANPDEVLQLPDGELGSVIDDIHQALKPEENAKIWGDHVHDMTDEEYAVFEAAVERGEQPHYSPELAEQASTDAARQLKQFQGAFDNWDAFIQAAFDTYEGRAGRGGSAPEGLADMVQGDQGLGDIPTQDAVGDIYSDTSYTRRIMEELFPDRQFTDTQVNEIHQNLRDDVDPSMSVDQYRDGVRNEVEYFSQDPLWSMESAGTLPGADMGQINNLDDLMKAWGDKPGAIDSQQVDKVVGEIEKYVGHVSQWTDTSLTTAIEMILREFGQELDQRVVQSMVDHFNGYGINDNIATFVQEVLDYVKQVKGSDLRAPDTVEGLQSIWDKFKPTEDPNKPPERRADHTPETDKIAEDIQQLDEGGAFGGQDTSMAAHLDYALEQLYGERVTPELRDHVERRLEDLTYGDSLLEKGPYEQAASDSWHDLVAEIKKAADEFMGQQPDRGGTSGLTWGDPWGDYIYDGLDRKGIDVGNLDQEVINAIDSSVADKMDAAGYSLGPPEGLADLVGPDNPFAQGEHNPPPPELLDKWLDEAIAEHGVNPDFPGNTPNEPPPTDFQPPPVGGEPQYPIQPTFTPNIPAAGFQQQQPGWLAQKFGAPESVFTRGKRDRTVSTQGVTAQNLFAEPNPTYLRERPEVLASGAARVDPKAFVESVGRRERDLVAAGFDQDLIQKLAAKDDVGEMMKFGNQEDVHKRLGPEWVLINQQFPIQWFSAESNFLQDTVQRLEELRQQGLNVNSPDVEDLLNQLADTHAQDFVKNAFNAQKLDGVAIPRSFFNYQKRLVTATDPFDNAAGRVYSRYMHRWRALTLAYMPRWALNTAVGSFALNMVKGVTPKDYMLASKLHRQSVFGEPRLGGVELGGITGMEYLEPGALGNLERSTGVGVTPMGERIVEGVQRIEDHFRRASFVHSLDKVSKRRMDEMGQLISNLERRQSIHSDEDFLQQVLGNPDMVQESIDDLNSFAYNYAALGPYERRYVRMAVPFWGWYKFISKVAYRLPVEFPGRANILANVGMLGAGYEDQLGSRPDWLTGVLPLGLAKGRLSYLSTMGMNPFSSIMNPLSSQGFVEGLGSLGQASPPIQALLSAYGLDTLRGGEVPISPEQGVASDYFGSLIDIKNRRETNPAQQAGLRRFIMGLIRSAPQARMGEQFLAGGRSVYPESIPFFDQRPMPTEPKDMSLLANLGTILGVAPKTYNLRGYQKGIKKRVKYAKSRNKTQMKRLKKATK